MKETKIIVVSMLIMGLILLPLAASAHGPGRFLFGLGAGLLTGYLLAPRPVYVAPPVYAAPPPVTEYVPAPAPPPVVREYSTEPQASAGPPPGPEAKCREWKLLDRHFEDRWDSYYGRWRQVPVEKWGWANVPCK